MRKATLAEFLKSSQTERVREAALADSEHPTRYSTLGWMKVRYRAVKDGSWGLVRTDQIRESEEHRMHVYSQGKVRGSGYERL